MVDAEMGNKKEKELTPDQIARRERLKEILKPYLDKKKLADLAGKMGINPQALTNWKNRGKISWEYAESLANITGYNFWWIMDGRFPKKSPKGKLRELELDRLIRLIESIDNYEKTLPKNTRFPVERRAWYISEMYRDTRLQTEEDFNNRMGELIVATFR